MQIKKEKENYLYGTVFLIKKSTTVDLTSKYKNQNHLFLKVWFLTNKLFPIPIVSNTTRPVMCKKYIKWFLNLHELMDVIFTNMVNRPDMPFVIW